MTEVHAQAQGSPFSPEAILYLLFRHKRKIMACVLIGIVAAGLVYILTPGTFRSHAKLMVRYVSERTVIGPDTSGGRVISTDQRGQNIINSELEIIHSHDLAVAVAVAVGPQEIVSESLKQDAFLRVRHAIKRRLGRAGGAEASVPGQLAPTIIMQHLRAEVPRQSNVIRLFYDGPTPQIAQSILTALVAQYLQKHQQVHSGGDAYGFLTQQTEQMKARLQQTEQQLQQMKAELGIEDIDDAKVSLLARRQTLQEAIWQAEAELAESTARAEVIRSALPESFSTTSRSATTNQIQILGSVRDRLRRLREKEIKLLDTFTEDSSPVQSIRGYIQKMERMLEEEKPARQAAAIRIQPDAERPTHELQQALVNDEARTASLKARIWALRNHFELVHEDLKRVDTLATRMTDLERRREMEESSYRQFSQRLERARIDDSLEAAKISNINVLQGATLASRPQYPNRLRRMLIALLLGCGLGLGCAVLAEHVLNTPVGRAEDLTHRTGLRPLLTIPATGNATGKGRRCKDRATHALVPHGDSGPGIACRLDSALIPFWQSLRDALMAGIDLEASGPHLVGVTGCSHGSGTTTVAAGLAVCLASSGEKRVLFVDASAGHAVADSLESAPARSCLILDAATGERIQAEGLDVLTCDADVPPPSEIGKQQSTLVKPSVYNEYDIIVYDLPPVEGASLTFRVARSLASILLVVAEGETRRDAVLHSVQLLGQATSLQPLVLFNKQRTIVPHWVRS